MSGAQKPVYVSLLQQRIAELAREKPAMGFTSLAHLIDIPWLHEAYHRTRKEGVVGVDGQTGKDYEADLQVNLQSLLDRAKSGTYVAPPVRRVYTRIPPPAQSALAGRGGRVYPRPAVPILAGSSHAALNNRDETREPVERSDRSSVWSARKAGPRLT